MTQGLTFQINAWVYLIFLDENINQDLSFEKYFFLCSPALL